MNDLDNVVETVERTVSLVKAIAAVGVTAVVTGAGGFIVGKVLTKKKLAKLQNSVTEDLK